MRKTVWALGGLLLGACSAGRILKVTDASNPAAYTAEKLSRWHRADSLWEGRGEPAGALAALKAYRKALARQSDVPELLTRHARACHLVATYVEPKAAKKQELYLEGARSAEKALLRHPGFRRIYEGSGDEVEAVGEVDGPYLESAFWYAANLGRMVSFEGVKVRIGNRAHLEAFIQRVLVKDESLYYGGAHRFLGVMHMVLPNPNLDSARVHFDKALGMSPLFFGTRTLMAEYLGGAKKDSAAFREQLEFVLRTRPDTLPDAAAENRYEQERAREMLSNRADRF